MHTAALQLDFTSPSVTAGRTIAALLAQDRSVDRATLLAAMERAYGASSVDGAWSIREAYDALELAEVLHLADAALPVEPQACLETLIQFMAALPTHSVRSEEQITLQQFSTPAP